MKLPFPVPGMDEETKAKVICDKKKDPKTGLCASAIEWTAFQSGSSFAKGRCPFCEEEGKYKEQ